MQEDLGTGFLLRLIKEGGVEVVMTKDLPRLGAEIGKGASGMIPEAGIWLEGRVHC